MARSIDGALDASQGMTLDEVLGESSSQLEGAPSQNSSLTVTDDITLGANTEITLRTIGGTSSTSYVAGDWFPLLQCNGLLTGKFKSLPEGTYMDVGVLPPLARGLKWQVHYDTHTLTVTVVNVPVGRIVTWTGTDNNNEFEDSANWDLNDVPHTGDIIKFTESASVFSFVPEVDLTGILVENGAGVDLSLNYPGETLHLSGDITIKSGFLTFDQGSAVYAQNIEIGEDSQAPASMFAQCDLHVTGSVDVGAGGEGSLQSNALTVSNVFVPASGTLDDFNNFAYFGFGSFVESVSVDNLIVGNRATTAGAPSDPFAYVKFFGTEFDANSFQIDSVNSTDVRVDISGGLFNVAGVGEHRDETSSIALTVGNDFGGAASLSAGDFSSNDTLYVRSGAIFNVGTFEQDARAKLVLDITNQNVGMNITGVAMLDGNLALQYLDGISPSTFSLGDSFTLIEAEGGFSAQFSSITDLPVLPEGLNWELIYSGTALTAKVIDQNFTYTPTGTTIHVNPSSVINANPTVQITEPNDILIIGVANGNTVTIDASHASGPMHFTNDSDPAGVILAGGTFELTDAQTLTLTGVVTLNSAQLVVDAGAVLNVEDTADFIATTNETVQVDGTMNWYATPDQPEPAGPGTVVINSDGTLNWLGGNLATNLINNGTGNFYGNTGWVPYFTNTGVINLWGSGEAGQIEGGLIIFRVNADLGGGTYSGTFEVASGVTLSLGDDNWEEGTTLTIDSGATLNWGQFVYADGPVDIENYGTVNFGPYSHVIIGSWGSYTLNNYGTVNGAPEID